MCQALKIQIKVLSSTIHKIIGKLPAAKQNQNKLQCRNQLKNIMLKIFMIYKNYRMIFTYPNIINQLEKIQKNPSQLSQEQVQENEKVQNQMNSMLENNQIVNNQQMEEEKSNEQITAGMYSHKLYKQGTYVMKDGKLVKGEAQKREHVDLSNWFAANADPEDLKKHKELMDRQHFGGPVWQGKGRPKSIIEEENPIYEADEKELNPYLKRDKDPIFEKVKR